MLFGELVQLVPLYNSVAPVFGGVDPPKAKAAVCVPAPAKPLLAVAKFPPDENVPTVDTDLTFKTADVELYHT
jgi:hypothetical protein